MAENIKRYKCTFVRHFAPVLGFIFFSIPRFLDAFLSWSPKLWYIEFWISIQKLIWKRLFMFWCKFYWISWRKWFFRRFCIQGSPIISKHFIQNFQAECFALYICWLSPDLYRFPWIVSSLFCLDTFHCWFIKDLYILWHSFRTESNPTQCAFEPLAICGDFCSFRDEWQPERTGSKMTELVSISETRARRWGRMCYSKLWGIMWKSCGLCGIMRKNAVQSVQEGCCWYSRRSKTCNFGLSCCTKTTKNAQPGPE